MVEETPAVTVIIPTYNSSGTLRLTLETVLLQDFDDFEVWVVGDGCTDDSETVVSSFGDKRFHWVNLPVNSGTPSVPRNEALRRARGRKPNPRPKIPLHGHPYGQLIGGNFGSS